MKKEERARYFVSASAGSCDGKKFAVVDRQDVQGGKGMRRVSFHHTMGHAKKACRALNCACK